MKLNVMRLTDFIDFSNGKAVERLDEGTIPVFGSNGIIGTTAEPMTQDAVVLGRVGACGATHYCKGPFWPSDNTIVAKPKVGHSVQYLYYLLKNTPLVEYAGGAAQPLLTKQILNGVRVRVHDALQAARIADILSAYDDLVENNRRRIALLEEAARLLYREWFVHFRFPGHEDVKIVDGLPEGWQRRTFDDVSRTIGGGTPKTSKPEYWSDGTIAWYTPTDVTRNSCLALLDSATKITEAGLRGSSAKMLPPGTVLMTSRASVGFFGIIDAPSCTNQGFISILPHNPSARMYFLHNLMYRVEEIRSNAGGATYREISKGKFRVLPVVLPVHPLLREFEDQTSTLHAQVQSLHSMNRRLAQARDLILPRIMNGEITV